MIVESIAKLITAIATLLGAIAWPIAVIVLGLFFRRELRSAASKIPTLIDRMRKVKLAGIEAELDRVANTADNENTGKITETEIRAAAKIAVEAGEYNLNLANELDKLCLEYDTIRKTLPSGDSRTRAMSSVLVRMRALAPSLVESIELYKGSSSPGSRLAAIAMMQMNPNACDITWLAGRFEIEQPFVFYHAALALQSLSNGALTNEEWDQLLGAAQRGLDKVRSFSGVPDEQTIEILQSIIDGIR